MLGVWNGVPYLFADFLQEYRNRNLVQKMTQTITTNASAYRLFLFYMAIPPILLTFFERPYFIAIAYAIAGAFFMPFLAVILLYMNNKKEWVKAYKNNWLTNVLLLASLLLFFLIFLMEIKKHLP